MKKPYIKPMVEFEEIMLDMPVAANCDQGSMDLSKWIVEQGYFNTELNCPRNTDDSWWRQLLLGLVSGGNIEKLLVS